MMSNTEMQLANNSQNADYRTFCILRVKELMEHADNRQADLIYRFARGLIYPHR